MYRWERRKMSLIVHCLLVSAALCKSIEPTTDPSVDNFDNNIIDFDEDYSAKFDKKYGRVPWESNQRFNKEINRYTLVKDTVDKQNAPNVQTEASTQFKTDDTTAENDYSVIPLELISTTEDTLISMIESTMEPDLTVIPLSTTKKTLPEIEIKLTVTLPSSTQSTDSTTEYLLNDDKLTDETTTTKREVTSDKIIETTTVKKDVVTSTDKHIETTTAAMNKSTTTSTEAPKITSTIKTENATSNKPSTSTVRTLSIKSELDSTSFIAKNAELTTEAAKNTTARDTHAKIDEIIKTNSTKVIETVTDGSGFDEDVETFTEADGLEETEVPEDYYDSKDVLPTTAPKTDALSVIFGLAGSVVESVVESVAERVVPKSIFDLFKRMQKQNEALEAERLRSREENGGIGQFGRGILKSISSGLSKPLSQLMQGVKDFGSLDTDRGFVSSLASGVTSVASAATSIADTFKDRVQAIYPGTVWCGDGHSATARSSDLGLFFFTDTCCREHDACKIYIEAGDTKYGLTNTGLFTRSHCSCDTKFRDCLRKTNSLVSTQIGLTYFNVLGPQCFRKAHPIVRCVRKTRITGQKCEEYELDYTKPKMWQWFDNETY